MKNLHLEILRITLLYITFDFTTILLNTFVLFKVGT